MIRVVHHVWSFGFGGIERLVLDLAAEQKQAACCSSVIHVGKPGGAQMQELLASGIPFDSAGLKKGSEFSITQLLRMKNYFHRFDIVHLHSFTPVVALAAWLSKKKIVYTEHGNFAFGRVIKRSDRINRRLLRFFLEHAVSFVTFNSHFTQAEAQKRYGLQRVKQQVIYNGIPTLHSAPSEVPAEFRERLHNKFIVGTTSRLAGFKRVDRLIDAFALFAEDKEDVCLLVVGDGPLRKELEERVSRQALNEKVVFAGYTMRPRDFQAVMDVCVFPSEGEPFGIAAVETLSLGKPTVVMADGGGILEVMMPLAPEDVANDISECAARLDFYYSIRDVDAQAEQRKEHAKKFDIAAMEQSLCKIYKDLLA